MITENSASLAGPRLSKCLSSASAATRVDTGCLTCLSGFRLLPAPQLCPRAAISVYIFFIISIEKGEAGEATRCNHHRYWLSWCLSNFYFVEAREALLRQDA